MEISSHDRRRVAARMRERLKERGWSQKEIDKAVPPTRSHYSESDIQTIGDIARRNSELVSESLRLAIESQIPETKASRLAVAQQILVATKKLEIEWPFLHLTFLSEVERDIALLEEQFGRAGYSMIANVSVTPAAS